jgi:hypothetical protein
MKIELRWWCSREEQEEIPSDIDASGSPLGYPLPFLVQKLN